MTITTPKRFWALNNTLADQIADALLTSADSADHYVDPGKTGQAWDLGTTTTNQALYKTADNNPIPNDFTISLWFRAHTLTTLSNKRLIDFGYGALTLARLTYYRFSDQTQGLTAKIHTSSSGGHIIRPNDTNWHHIAIRHDQTNAENSLWIDGSKNTWPYTKQPGFLTPTLAFARTVADADSNLPCQIDAIGIWDVPLTDQEIAALSATPEPWPIEEPSTIRPWPIWRWLCLALQLAQQSESEDLLYDTPETLQEDLETCQAVLQEQFALPPDERWYWSLRSALLNTLAYTARFAADANLGPLTEANPTQRFDPQQSFTVWGASATANQDPEDRYNESAEYLAEAEDLLALLPALLAVTPAERDRDEILTALDTLGNLTTLFLADTRLMS